MKTMHRYLVTRFGRQKGSALLVSLMVMVGLSLLGLGFVAITETESAIAINERNSAQALSAAETGVHVVMEWFQDTDWTQARGILPANINAFKTERRLSSYTGYYKPNGTHLMFDKPFKGEAGNRFYGDGDINPPTADVWIYRDKNSQSNAFLDRLNAALFVPDRVHNESVRLTDIRVYAPPMPGATRNGNGFWETDNPRYGLATIRVTAQKLSGSRVVAERSVKAVITETPFPTVDGAIETSGTLVGQGSFEVYWGKVLSEKGIQLARPAVGLPWFDARDTMWFEYGFDSPRPWAPNTPYAMNDIIMAPLSTQNNVDNVRKFSYKVVTAGTSHSTAPADADWPTNPNATFSEASGVMWQAIPARAFPIDGTRFYTSEPWLYQMIERTIADPWLHVRARQEVVYGNNKMVPCGVGQAPVYHPCDYADKNTNPEQPFSNFFQWQTTTESGLEPQRIEVVFPTMDYEFWKNIAMSGNNENGVYYLRYADPTSDDHNEFIGPGGKREKIYYWLNALTDPTTGRPKNEIGPGFYFFDTRNRKNPQFGKGGLLTPTMSLNAGSIENEPFQMQGYIYLNAENYGSTGQGDITQDDVYATPGEPFRDVGYRRADETSGPNFRLATAGGPLPGGSYIVDGHNNGAWDFQDVNQNARFDLFLDRRTITRPDGSIVNNAWVPVAFFDGCTPGSNGDPGANCSEPHEPYLNMTYPDQAMRKGSVKIEWYDPSLTAAAAVQQYRKPKMRTDVNQTVICTATSTPAECTSNGYDVDGALVTIDAMLWGALYNEGGYAGSGNARYYGALLMRAAFDSTGTPEVYFNECLARGCLEDQLRLQRVTMTSWQTD